jgi:hypothetical protein
VGVGRKIFKKYYTYIIIIKKMCQKKNIELAKNQNFKTYHFSEKAKLNENFDSMKKGK